MTGAAVRVDPETERARTPGAAVYRHFNAAGCSLPSSETLDTVFRHLILEGSEGGYEAATAAVERTSAVYSSVARLVGGSASEIGMFDSASNALRTVIDSWVFEPGSHIIVSRSTYVSHALHLMSLARSHQLTLQVVDAGPDGSIDLELLKAALSRAAGAPSLLSVAHVPTSSGLVEPVTAVGVLAREYGALYLVDATQSVGQIEIDVDAIGCDVLVGTGRKFLRGPRGTGFAYVRSSASARLARHILDVRGTVWDADKSWSSVPGAVRFETWEHSVAARLGLGSAIDQALEIGVDRINATIDSLAAPLRDGLSKIRGVTVTDPAAAASGIVTFAVDGIDARDAVLRLRSLGTRLTSVPASHGQWDLGARSIPAVVRASVHVYNREDEIDELLSEVREIAATTVVRGA